MSEKIGILTFHKSLNYGSALQAFALNKKLLEMGYDAEIIDYTQNNYYKLYGLLQMPFSISALKYDINHLLHLCTLIRRKRYFMKFASENLCLSSKKLSCGEDLRVFEKDYEILICGSDQIWNPNARDFDINYFFPGIVNIKKISYAVSLNSGDLNKLKNKKEIQNYLKDFQALSVRENSGKECLEELINYQKTVSVVLDPTLLHNREIYDSISAERQIERPYIFLYTVNFADYVLRAAEILSKRTGLPVYTLYTGRSGLKLIKTKGAIKICKKNVGPKGFISLIRYADYVVTNSFHGTAFSIIYEKQFWAIGNSDARGEIIRDERICDILEKLNISERFVKKQQTEYVNLENCVDYSKVNKIKNQSVQKALDYLEDSIKYKGDNSYENSSDYSL